MRKENSYYTMNHTVEDLSLLNALRQGDGNAFDHLFRRYYPMLCAYAHRLVSLEDAEEIVQEVMLWLWENRGDLIIESSLNQYLFKMTYRRVLNHLTREQVKTKAEAAFYERTQAALCEVDYGRFEELDRKIKEAMAALPDINPEKPDVPLNKNDAFQKVQKRRVQENGERGPIQHDQSPPFFFHLNPL